MDPTGPSDVMRRALYRGVAAFVAVFVIGSGLVYALRAIAGIGPAAPTPTPSVTPSPVGQEPPEPTTPDAYLAWVPGGMPEGFAEALATAPEVGQLTIASADNVWMRRSFDADGKVVDRPPSGFMYPIDATAVDPRSFASFLPASFRQPILGLGPLEGILSETSAKLRGIGPDGQLEFRDGITVRIAGVLPDELVGGYELLVNRATGRRIGIRQERYAVFLPPEGERPRDAELQRTFRKLLPTDATYRVVEVRAPGRTRFLRMSDALLPPLLLKTRFGEFAARPASFDPGFIDVEPGWVTNNIVEAPVPLLGTITCHRRFVPLVRKAMRELERKGLGELVVSYSGCYAARHTLGDPSASLSHHSWGIAIDINAEANPFGAEPTQDPALVEVLERWGMIWGGRFIVPDGHHFEFVRPPKKSP